MPDVNMTKIAVRKTGEMKFIELREQLPIEDVILRALSKTNGVYQDAARLIGIDNSTLSRWIDKLVLVEAVNRIRLGNDKAPFNGTALVSRPGERLALCIADKCRECEITYPEIFKPVFIGVVSDEVGMYAIVSEPPHGNLARPRKHWFLLKRSEIENLIHPSDEVH